MKKKKEFFQIRKDRKRKNGANARACVRIQRQDSPRPFAAFQTTTNDREKPLTVFEPKDKPTDRKTVVLFSKQNRPSLVF